MPIDNTAKKQRKGFKKGVSGNPLGRPQGSRNKATLAAQSLLDGQAERLTQMCIDKALEGDMQALKICLDRLLPPTKERTITCPALPQVEQIADLPKLTQAILQAVTKGELTPSEAATLSTLAANHGKMLETMELEQRISALEAGKK